MAWNDMRTMVKNTGLNWAESKELGRQVFLQNRFTPEDGNGHGKVIECR